MTGLLGRLGSTAGARALGLFVVCAVVLAGVAAPSSAGSKHPLGPKISSLSLSRTKLPHSGGSIHLKASIKRASTCRVTSTPHISGLPSTHSCSSGHLSLSVHVGADPSKSSRRVTFTLKASKGSHHVTKSVHLTQAGAVATTPSSPTPISSAASANAPLPSNGNTGSSEIAALTSVSCAAAAHCVAVGTYYGPQGSDSNAQLGLIDTFNGTSWTATEAPLPSGLSTSEPYIALNSVSCYSTKACVTVGEYLSTDGYEPYVAVLSGSTWTAEATTTPPDPDDSAITLNGELNQVSCAADGTCVAVGYYNPPDVEQPLIETPSSNGWVGAEAPLPDNDRTSGEIENYLNGVSCSVASSTDYCTAVGGYVPSDGDEAGLGETLSAGEWSATQLQPTADIGDDRAVSCAGSTCAAEGEFNTYVPWIQPISANAWGTATAAPQPSGSTGSAELNAIDCVPDSSSVSCVGVGGYYPSTEYDAFIDAGSGLTYTATAPALPSNVTTGNPDALLSAVSCATADACVAVGSYESSSGGEGLVETGSGTSWAPSTAPEPSGDTFLALPSVSCVASYGCVAVGRVETSEVGVAGLTVTLPL